MIGESAPIGRSRTAKYAFGDNGSAYGVAVFDLNPGEVLKSLDLASTSYGYGSFRRIALRTSLDRTFEAGAGGGNVISPAVAGCAIVGFAGSANVDNFVNGFSVWLSCP